MKILRFQRHLIQWSLRHIIFGFGCFGYFVIDFVVVCFFLFIIFVCFFHSHSYYSMLGRYFMLIFRWILFRWSQAEKKEKKNSCSYLLHIAQFLIATIKIILLPLAAHFYGFTLRPNETTTTTTKKDVEKTKTTGQKKNEERIFVRRLATEDSGNLYKYTVKIHDKSFKAKCFGILTLHNTQLHCFKLTHHSNNNTSKSVYIFNVFFWFLILVISIDSICLCLEQ